MHHDKIKHVEIDRHFVKKKIDDGRIKLEHTPSSHQIANVLTKMLPIANFNNMQSNICWGARESQEYQ